MFLLGTSLHQEECLAPPVLSLPLGQRPEMGPCCSSEKEAPGTQDWGEEVEYVWKMPGDPGIVLSLSVFPNSAVQKSLIASFR